MANEDTGIVQRGLMLLGVIGIIAATVLFILFRNRGVATVRTESRPELAIASVALPASGFPLSINWGVLHDVGDSLPSVPGWETRYTATRVLAHRGSPKLPVPVLCEMLDENRQMRNFRTQLPDGRDIPDQAAAYEEILIALKAVAEWRKNAPAGTSNEVNIQPVVKCVVKLTNCSNNVVRTRAREVMLTLNQKNT
jgi:hypothetical protein